MPLPSLKCDSFHMELSEEVIWASDLVGIDLTLNFLAPRLYFYKAKVIKFF